MHRCFRYLNMNNYDDVFRLGWSEFLFMWNAFLAKRDDEVEMIHLQAWLNQAAKATTKDGKKSLYKKFSDFYKEPKEPVNSELYDVANRLADYREKGGI